MKYKNAWKQIDLISKEKLGPNYWHQGYFHEGFGKNENYIRKFDELINRDVAISTLFPLENKRILDVGCGSGLYVLTFLKLGAQFVAGQDLSEHYIKLAKEDCDKNGFNNVELKVGDCCKLQFSDNNFDAVFSGDVFEHLTTEVKIGFLKEMYRVLKPGGIITIKTPNKKYLICSNQIRRVFAILKFKNPFKIHIAHTHNNPDTEHHGLTTHQELKMLIMHCQFHEPKIEKVKMVKNGIPDFILNWLRNRLRFNEHIIISARKPIFYEIYK